MNLRSISLVLFFISSIGTMAQCPYNNTYWTDLTPSCPGSAQTTCIYGGEYCTVNVIAGNTYVFSTCSSAAFDTEITLYPGGGGASIASNDDFCGFQSEITWVATFTGVVDILVDQWLCVHNSTCAELTVTCLSAGGGVANDDCINAIPIACGSSTAGTTVGATFDNVGTCGTTNTAPGVWYSFVGTGGAVTLSLCNNASYDTKLSVFTGSCAGLVCIDGNDDAAGCGLTSEVTFVSTLGTTYYVLVHGFGTATGTFTLDLACTTPPVGDCIYSLNLYDSFGDGWDGSTVTVTINGTPTAYTVTAATNIVLIGVNIGDIVQLTYTSGGGIFENEISYSLTLNGGILFTDGPNPATGLVYTAIVDCIQPPASPQDCAGGITICSNQTLNGNSGGTGSIEDLNFSNQGCLSSSEQQGTWYYFSPSTGGTIGMTISPQNAADDYDFAIWGPYTTTPCPPPGPPARCSYAAPSGDTGMNNTSVDNSEGAGGDKWVNDLNVNAGEIYIMYIDNWSTSGQPFDLSWQLGGGASLDCTVLPVELTNFSVENQVIQNKLNWGTATEINSEMFIIERSGDGIEYVAIGEVPASGNSSTTTLYSFIDTEPISGLNYYRLLQTDINGQQSYSSVVTTSNRSNELLLNEPFWDASNEHIILSVRSQEDVSLTFELFDLIGRPIKTALWHAGSGFDRTEVPLPPLSQGTYIYRLNNEKGEALKTGKLYLTPIDH